MTGGYSGMERAVRGDQNSQQKGKKKNPEKKGEKARKIDNIRENQQQDPIWTRPT